MAVITGIGGAVTLANGYVAKVQGWRLETSAIPQVERRLDAVGNFVNVDTGCPHFSARASWTCELEATCLMNITGLSIANPSGWSVLTACEANPYYVMGDQFIHVTAGYRSASWEARGLQDSTVPPEFVGDSPTVTFTQTTGASYVIPSIVTGVSEENGLGARAEIISGEQTNVTEMTATTLPLAGIMGVLELTNAASGGATVFHGDVLVTGTTVALDRGDSAPAGRVMLSAVSDGVFTGYGSPNVTETGSDALLVAGDVATGDYSS